MSRPLSVVLIWAFLVSVYSYYCLASSPYAQAPPQQHTKPQLSHASPIWSSPYESWHKRALLTPHPDPHNFVPTLDTLLLSARYNGMLDDGLSLAIFSTTESFLGADGNTSSTSIAVDGQGRVLILSAHDTGGFTALAEQARALHKNTRHRHSWWPIKTIASCQSSDIVDIPVPPRPTLGVMEPNMAVLNVVEQAGGASISVYAFRKSAKALDKEVLGYSKLPDVLWELLGLIGEAYESYNEPRDEVVLDRVYKIVKQYRP